MIKKLIFLLILFVQQSCFSMISQQGRDSLEKPHEKIIRAMTTLNMDALKLLVTEFQDICVVCNEACDCLTERTSIYFVISNDKKITVQTEKIRQRAVANEFAEGIAPSELDEILFYVHKSCEKKAQKFFSMNGNSNLSDCLKLSGVSLFIIAISGTILFVLFAAQ